MTCCQKIYCKSCLDDLKGRTSKCPNCQQVYTNSFDQASNSCILSLSVRCTSANKGCLWLGKLQELERHHMTCPNQLTRCSYHTIGCQVKLLRAEQEIHNEESLEHHFSCALDTVVKLNEVYTELRRELDEIKQVLHPQKPVAVFKMQGFQEYKAANKCWYSPGFLSHPGGYKMCLRVEATGIQPSQTDCISVFVCLMQGENDSSLVWPFRGSITVELLNQLRDSNHHRGVIHFQSPNKSTNRVSCVVSSTGRGWPQFIPHAALEYQAEITCQYLRDDCLYFRIAQVSIAEANKPWLSCTL